MDLYTYEAGAYRQAVDDVPVALSDAIRTCPMNLSLKPLALASLTLALGLSVPALAATSPAHAHAATAATPAATQAPKLHAAMRSLWHGHIVHAREYAMAVHAHNDAKAKKAADAVVANAHQISDAVGGFYGKPAGDQMMTLLGGHWGAVKALTDARAHNDTAAADTAMSKLTSNAGDIAKFLAGANPNLPEDTVRGMLLAHGAHHSQQINLINAGDHAGEAKEWTAMQAHMDSVADALAGAIAKQFPAKAN
jgi:hypothetical protein